MGGLDLNNILTGDEVDTLFDKYTGDDDNTTESQENQNNSDGESVESKEQETTEVNIDDIFAPESVGSDEDKQGDKEDTDSSGTGTSPNFYSSIAKALKDEGIFPDLDDDDEVKDADDFKDLIQKRIDDGLNEAQKRINEALGSGMEPSRIRLYEETLNSLQNTTEEIISAEDEQGENIRKQLIYQDFINRGYSQQRAEKEVNKSINAGTDIDDALEALESNKQFFREQYNREMQGLKDKQKAYEDQVKKEMDSVTKSIMNDSKIFGDVQIDKRTRQKIVDNLFKLSETDKETGQKMTSLQKYQKENKEEFFKNLGIIFTLTNGFKDLSGLLKGKVKKEVNKGLRELEHTLRGNSSKPFEGNLKLMNESPETSFRGWDLDL